LILLLKGAAAVTLLLYVFVIVKLYLNGARPPTGLLPWRYFRDLHDYRQLLARQGHSTNSYYMLLFVSLFTLLLAIVVGIYLLSVAEQSLLRMPLVP
jgi:hypothetical protein